MTKKLFYVLLALTPLLTQMKCMNEQGEPTPPLPASNTTVKADSDTAKMHVQDTSAKQDTTNREASADTAIQKPVEIKYHLAVMNAARRKKLLADTNRLAVLLALNRVDEKNLARLKSVIVPDTFVDLKYYSPYPDSLSAVKDVSKIIFFSYPAEAFAAYDHGALVRWGPISLGKRKTPTPTGLYHTNWKSPEKRSTVKEEWIMKWYYNLDDKMGVSMHQYNMPGYPASHACVRLTEQDAMWFYDWAEPNKVEHKKTIAKGTPVIIFGQYEFGAHKPWMALAKDNKATDISEEELNKEVDQLLHPAVAHKK